ncbi:MAG: hypothetical protein ABF812_15930 [Gluconobacter cerinus]|uniref:hypothetical protein n=1 Tax=Gluconobacter cerinus TaxID=38307 RepID=UPI0039E8DDE1
MRSSGGPVHEGSPLPVHIVVPQLDAFGRSTGFQQGVGDRAFPQQQRHGSSAGAPQPVQAIVNAGSASSQWLLQRRQMGLLRVAPAPRRPTTGG